MLEQNQLVFNFFEFRHMKTLHAIGIDVGYYSTKFTLGRSTTSEGQPILTDQFPSLTPSPTIRPQDLPGALPHDGCVIAIAGVNYFIGKSTSQLVGSSFGYRPANQAFSGSPGYKALLLGALYYIARQHKVDQVLEINELVLGLPMTTVFTHTPALAAMAKGIHTIPSPTRTGNTVEVRIHQVHVIAQPQGCLLNMGAKIGSALQDREVLILDMGGGTFDWFLSEGLRPRTAACGAAEVGTIECAGAICDQLDPSYKSDPNILRRVDLAMREGHTCLELDGTTHAMVDLWPSADAVLLSAFEQMERKLGSTATIQHVLPTGGGAALLGRVLPRRFPKLAGRIEQDSDPIYSNVKGFHKLAERLHKAQGGVLCWVGQ